MRFRAFVERRQRRRQQTGGHGGAVLLSIVPGMALAIAMAVGQVYGPRGLALPIRAFTYFFAARRSISS